MSANIFKYILKFVFFVLLQGLILNQIDLGYIHFYVYIIFLITLPCNISRELVLFIAFLLGLSIDVFSNTFGIHAFATVFAAFFRYYLLQIFAPKDDRREELVPSITTFGLGTFFKYCCLMVIIHHAVLFTLDYASFSPLWFILVQIVLSSAATLLVLMIAERIKTK